MNYFTLIGAEKINETLFIYSIFPLVQIKLYNFICTEGERRERVEKEENGKGHFKERRKKLMTTSLLRMKLIKIK